MRVRQIVLVASDFDAVERDFADLFGWQVAYRDPIVGKWGLRNIIIPVGGEFIEVVSPTQDETSAGRHMARIGGDGGYMVMIQVADRERETARLVEQGVRVAYRSDQETYCLSQFHPADCGGLILAWEEVLHPDGRDWREAMGYWHAAGGHGWTRHVATARVGSMKRVVLGNGPASALAARYAQLLAGEVTNDDGERIIRIDGPALGFTDADGGSVIRRIDLEAHDRDAVLDVARKRNLLVNGEEVRVAGVNFRLI